ncbi:MAG: hypothetical protein C5B50_07930 [Verrucomicrobia bacterium]|nr:MAG: hypothetical protein C5B50_07930 [Verrucomicrobiota bacterium]
MPDDTDTIIFTRPKAASVEEIEKEWRDLTLRVAQLEAGREAMEQENKILRQLLERVMEHRQKSHSELVLLLAGLVSKLPINDVGVVVSRLVEHNNNVCQVLGALGKGKTEAPMAQPAVLKSLEQAKRDLIAGAKPLVEELIQLDVPLEHEMLRSLESNPDVFFSPGVVRASRCFLKGQLPKERIVRQFGQEALLFFNDLTTDPKLNPRPKQEEIVLGFKNEFESLAQQASSAGPEKQQALMRLYQQVQRSKAATEEARAQKTAFHRLTFLLEVLHYYQNQSTEAPDVIFAQRLPGLIEQLVVPGPQDKLDEKMIVLAENLLGFITSAEHRQMVINNIGKGGDTAKTLKYVLRLRAEQSAGPEMDQIIADFLRHFIPPQIAPQASWLVPVLRLVPSEARLEILKAILHYDRIPKETADSLAKATAKELGVALPEPSKVSEAEIAQLDRQRAWGAVKGLISARNDASIIAAAIRDRLNAKYDADELRQSWLTLTESDALQLIKIFCQIPYMANGKTDPIARTVIETYVTRLLHEKYAGTYKKVVNSLRNMFAVRPDNPTLLNFLALIRWVSPEAAAKVSADVGMAG